MDIILVDREATDSVFSISHATEVAYFFLLEPSYISQCENFSSLLIEVRLKGTARFLCKLKKSW